MAIPDARKTFGQLQAGPANAPRATQLAPQESIQSATLPHLVMARLADNVVDLTEKMRLAGINNDKQKIEAYGAELGAREAGIRQDQLKEQQEKGEMWTPEQLTENYNQRLTAVRSELAPKYKVDWIADEKDAYENKWLASANESYQRSVVAPRMADIGRRTVEDTAQNHLKRAAASSASGDLLQALSAVSDAVNTYDSGNAPYLFTPEHRAQMKARLASDETMKALVREPKRALELVNLSLSIRDGVNHSGDERGMAVDPMSKIPTLKLLDWRNDFGAAVHAQEKLAEQEKHKQLAIQANGYQNELILFTTDDKTTPAMIQQRLLMERTKLSDMVKSDPGNPMADVLGQGIKQMSSLVEQAQRKAEASREKAQKAAGESLSDGAFLASGMGIDASVKADRARGDRIYSNLLATAKAKGLSELQTNQMTVNLVKQLGYLPGPLELLANRGLNSQDEKLRAAAAQQLKPLIEATNGRILEQLPPSSKTIMQNVITNNQDPETAAKNYSLSLLDTPQSKATYDKKVDVALTGKESKYRPEVALPKAFDGAVVPGGAEIRYRTRFADHMKTNGQDPEAAHKATIAELQKDFQVTKSDGKKVVRENQPAKYGIKDEDATYQTQELLKGIKGKDGKPMFYGNERTQLTFVKEKNGKPVYNVSVLDKTTGQPQVLVDSRGPAEVEFDPSMKRPVVPPPLSVAERTGKVGNTVSKAAANFETPANKKKPEGNW